MMSIDCLDWMCYEPGGRFDTQMYSKKHNGPGIKYEVGICIRTGLIVWINGPFKAGEMNDLQVFESMLEGLLYEWEFVEVDSRYRGNNERYFWSSLPILFDCDAVSKLMEIILPTLLVDVLRFFLEDKEKDRQVA